MYCRPIQSRDWTPNSGDRAKGIRLETTIRWPRWYQRGRRLNFADTELQPRTSVNADQGTLVHDGRRSRSQDSASTRPGSPHQHPNVRFLEVPDARPAVEKTFKPAAGLTIFYGRKIHGKCFLPPGYELSLLPLGTPLLDSDGVKHCQPDERRLWIKLLTLFKTGAQAVHSEWTV